jgi:hypothetical protein
MWICFTIGASIALLLPQHPLMTHLPGIQHYLSHAWVHELVITNKAVKHNDATVHTAMWDN